MTYEIILMIQRDIGEKYSMVIHYDIIYETKLEIYYAKICYQ